MLPALRDAGVTIAGFALARFARSRAELRGFFARIASR
jgi:hypothetical protein